jgi:hypothetical protein
MLPKLYFISIINYYCSKAACNLLSQTPESAYAENTHGLPYGCFCVRELVRCRPPSRNGFQDSVRCRPPSRNGFHDLARCRPAFVKIHAFHVKIRPFHVNLFWSFTLSGRVQTKSCKWIWAAPRCRPKSLKYIGIGACITATN